MAATVHGVESGEVVAQGVGLVELVAAVVRLRLDVNAHDVEPGPLVAHRGAAGTAAEVDSRGPIHRPYQDSSAEGVCDQGAADTVLMRTGGPQVREIMGPTGGERGDVVGSGG